MMNRRKYLIIAIIIVILLIIGLIIAGGLGIYLSQRSFENKKELFRPPVVYVYTPVDGETFALGTSVQAHIGAAGVNPLARIEMWSDGELLETHNPTPSTVKGASQTNVVFDIEMTEGPHMLFWRAVDLAGLVGQSAPVTIFGQSVGEGETVEVQAQEGQTLQDIANEQGTDLGSVDQLNPNLGGNPLPGGTGVKIPAPPPSGSGGQPPPPPPAAPPPVSIIPPAPLPVTPPGVSMLPPAVFPVIDISSILPLLITVPKAPTNLEAGYEDCTIRLSWIDNADNETQFKVWMARLGGPPQLIAILQGSPSTGPAWYEFKSPEFGIYSFWVEAVTALTGQPSEIKWVGVTDTECASDQLATNLEIEGLDMHISGGFDMIYCYLSLEGRSAQRIPAGDKFINVLNQWGDITKYWGGSKRILLPIPSDEEVSLEGECMGSTGNAPPTSLGKFQASVPRDQWDGRRLEVSGSQFIVGYRIQLHGSTQAHGLFFYTDHSIPQPYDVVVAQENPSDPSDPVEKAILARRPFIGWKWDGDESKITSFTIYLDGKVFQWAENDWRKTRLLLPAGCGVSYQLQVAANSGDAQSVPSAAYTYETLPCPILAEVHFQSIYAFMTDDSTFNPLDVAGSVQYSPCDQLGVYGKFWVTGSKHEERYGGTSNISSHMTCKIEYPFTKLGFDEDKITMPIDPLNPTLSFGTEFHESDFWNDDDFGYVKDQVPAMTIDQWRNFDQTFTYDPPDPDDTAVVRITIRVRGFEFSE